MNIIRIQNPEQVGTALKTLTLRLRGAKTELEEAGLETDNMAESTSTLQAKLKALTHGKVDIMLDADTFKSTTQILREMSAAYEDMTDIERAAALELMGGKRQANILASVIKNFDVVEQVIQTSLNSEGSALAENEKYLNSIQGHIDQLNNSTQTMWMNFMNADAVKFFIDIARAVVETTDKVGLLKVALAALVAKTTWNADSFGQFFKLDINETTGKIEKFGFSLSRATKNAKGLGIAAKAASISTKLLNAAISMGIILIASWAIEKIVEGLDNLIHAEEKAAQAAEEAINAYESTQETLNKQKSTIDSLASSYERLSQGVDLDTNENISLATDAYKEYLNVCNDIADMYPELVSGFDAEGNAILSLKGNVDELIKSYKEAAQASRQKLIASSDDIFTTFKNTYDSDPASNFGSTGLTQQLKLAEKLQDLINIGSQGDINSFFEKLNAGNIEIDGEKYSNVEFTDLIESAGLNEDFWKNSWGLRRANIDVDLFKQQSSKLLSFIKATTAKMNAETTNVKTLMDAYLGEDLDYAKLDAKTQSTVNQVISNLNADFINGFENADDLWTWVKTNVVDAFADPAIGKTISDGISRAFDIQSQFESGDLSVEKYKDQILGFVDDIKKSGLDETVQEQILQMFDIDFSNADSIGQEIDQMVNYVNSIVDDKTKDKVLQLSYSDLQIINSDQFKVEEGTLLTWDQLKAKIKETKIALTEDFTTDNLAEYAESVNAIQSSISTYKEALESLESGTFTFTDFMELIGQFPELADGVDLSSKEFRGLSDNLKRAIRHSPDNLVDDLKDLRAELAEAGKSTDYIDQLIESIEGMPSDAVDSLASKYSTLADEINAAKVAQNELQAAMSENPNEGYETRGEAIEAMKTLMEEGKIGSESELWSIAEAFGFTPDSSKTINENADALHKFITTREKWYATDEDGNYTYEGIESFIEYVAKNQDVLDKFKATWSYKDGKFEFDLDNDQWDAFAKAIGLSSEEFSDLMIQVGQFFGIKWGDADDIATKINKIAGGSETASEKIKKMTDEVESFVEKELGKDLDFDNLTLEDIAEIKMPEGMKSEEFAKIIDLLKTYLELKKKINGEDPLAIESTLDKSGLEGLSNIEKLQNTIRKNADGTFFVNEGAFRDTLREAGYTEEQIDSLIVKIREYQKLASQPPSDPLGVSSTKASIDTVMASLDSLGIKYIDIKNELGQPVFLDVNAKDLITALAEKGWTSAQISSYLSTLTSGENGVDIAITGDISTEAIDAAIKEATSGAETVEAKVNYGLGTQEPPEDQTANVDYKLGTQEQPANASQETTVDYNIGTQEPPTNEDANVNYQKGTQEPPENQTAYVNYQRGTQEQPTDPDKEAEVDYTVNDGPVIEYEPPTKTGDVEYTPHMESWTPPTKYGKVIYSSVDGGAGSTQKMSVKVDGTAHADGTAYQSGSWGAPKSEEALVGELGPELRVRGNQWTLIGQDGAEFTDIRKGDIVFNHKQTKSLLENGYVTGRGKAYVGGTAFASGGGTFTKYTFSDTSGSEISDAAGKLSKAAQDVSKSSEELSEDFKEVFDWIEVRLEEITEDIDLKSAKLENTVGASKQNAIIDDMIDLNQKLYNNLTAGASRYYQYAEKLLAKIPAQYREAAQDGSIAIESFTGEVGESTLEAIQDYREWVQKGADATQQAEETLTEIANLAKQAIDNIAAEYENKTSLRDSRIEQLEAYNEFIETDQGYESASIYQAMIDENKANIKTLEKQRDAMQKELNERVASGEIKVNSDAWYEAVNDIAAVDTEIVNLKTDNENLQDSINQLHWDKFDSLISRLESVSDEAGNLIDILSNEDVVDEDGNWTDEGITSLGLHAQRMEAAEVQARKFADEIAYLDENWEKLGYTEDEYLEKRNELKDSQYDAIKSYHDEKDAIVDLNQKRVDAIKKGIEKEIEAYEELIEAQKEALDAEKDLDDFQRSIEDSQKEIGDIERKLAALSGDNSASARAQRAKLQAELAKAQQDLQDKYYDRSISDQQQALDRELENFREGKDKEMEGWDEYLENTNQVVSDSLATVQANTEVVYQTLQAMGEEYSLSITESLTSPWQEGENAIQSFAEKFGVSMSATVEELQEFELEFLETMAEIEAAGSKAAQTVDNNFERYTNHDTPSPKDENDQKDDAPAQYRTYTVKSGDSLWVIAKSQLGDGSRWQEIYKLNKDKISDPNLITKGQKLKIPKYAKGTLGVKNNQLAWIDELGEELILRPQNGRLSFMEKGTSVIPADITANLMEWGELDPSVMLERNRPEIKLHPEVHNTEVNITLDVAEVVHIDTVSQENMPDLTKAVEKQLDKYMKNLNNQIRRYVR